ncbi:hypothetical protein [Chryseobacterium paridis]|uniref:Uncharacterized protein n=1 Tax=Chryseobacterium paridis TaxID=2800328 RepID=A0ABS1FUN4_9FLAO|nr:hypothetical protein [Chryseobacterium paridis]MBK1896132.1 hypothetical protein [Chryseobacterium paridis]
MLKVVIIFFLLSFIFFTSQVKISNKDCLKISTEVETLFYGYPNNFIITNNTDNNYLLNISGFLGTSNIYVNKERLLPIKPEFSSNPMDWNNEECKRNILLIPKHQTVKSVLHINVIRGFYEFDDSKKYEIDFETTHTTNSPYYYGCKKYVDSLLNQGYKIYDGKLKGKLELILKK